MTPAARLRDAARVLRERAGAATPGPWEARPPHGWSVGIGGELLVYAGNNHVTPGGGEHGDDGLWEGDAAYIALMSPTVALALADWLEEADRWAVWDDLHEPGDNCPECDQARCALAVADAVLGGQG